MILLNSCGSSRVYGNSWPRKMKFTFVFRSICLLVYVFVNVRCVYHFRVHESLVASYFTIKYMYIPHRWWLVWIITKFSLIYSQFLTIHSNVCVCIFEYPCDFPLPLPLRNDFQNNNLATLFFPMNFQVNVEFTLPMQLLRLTNDGVSVLYRISWRMFIFRINLHIIMMRPCSRHHK